MNNREDIIPMIEQDNNKIIIHFMWVTSEQLVSSGEILNAIKCLESLIRFREDSENDSLGINNNSNGGGGGDIDYQILHNSVKNQEEINQKVKNRFNKKYSKEIIKFRLTSLEEAITRIKIAELLFQYTHNFNDARYNLEKSALLLSADQQSTNSLELLCKISFFLIEIFYNGGATNLVKQEIKKSKRYAKLLNSNEWMLYFLIKESYIVLKSNTINNNNNSNTNGNNTNNNTNNNNQLKLSHQSLDQAIQIVNEKLNSNPFLLVLLTTIKCHYSIMHFDYSTLNEMLEYCFKLLNEMNLKVSEFNSDANKIPEFFHYLMDGFKSTNSIIQQSRSTPIKIRDSILSFKQLKVYNNLVYIIYQIRVGSFKSIDQQIQNLQIDLQELFNYLQLFNDGYINIINSPLSTTVQLQQQQQQQQQQLPQSKDILAIPIFHLTCGPQYLSCVCYVICAIHSRALGEQEKAIYCLEKSQQLIDSQLNFIYNSSEANTTPQQMKESRALVRLKFLVYENIFYIKITSMELDQSFQQIKNCVDIFQTYPTLFTDGAESTIHYMSSIFLQSIGDFQNSKNHLNLSINKCTRFDTQIQCITRLIFLNIYSGQIDRATVLVNDYLSPLSNHPQLILRCTTLLLEGVLLLYNSPELAKNKLRECLNLSNNQIGHAQLTCNILNQLAKLYISLYPNLNSMPEQTEQNIRSMLDSSLSLSNILNDLNGKTSTLNILSNLPNSNSDSIRNEIKDLLNKKEESISNFYSNSDKKQYLLNLLKLNK
ncbi:hypothetical protein ACTFIZ_006287 [Dictyostelium cf. discoideum]